MNNFLEISEHFFGNGRSQEIVNNWNETTKKYAEIFTQNHCLNLLKIIKKDDRLKIFFDEMEIKHGQKIYITKNQQYTLIEWFLPWADDEDIKHLTNILKSQLK